MYQNETFNDTCITKTHDETEEIKIGLVSNCKKLNVREKPTIESSVVCEIVCRTELMIDEKESTEEFYKIFTASGIEGFCMKKFITVQS